MRNKPATDTFEGEYTSNPMSNSTQKNEIKQIEKAIDEGFAESERDLKDKKTPLDQPTQNDWEVRFNDRFLNNWGTLLDIKHFIRKELADARREVIADLFSNQDFLNNLKWTIQDHMNRAFKDFNEDYFIPGEMRDVGAVADRTVEAVLATLREEEGV